MTPSKLPDSVEAIEVIQMRITLYLKTIMAYVMTVVARVEIRIKR